MWRATGTISTRRAGGGVSVTEAVTVGLEVAVALLEGVAERLVVRVAVQSECLSAATASCVQNG